MHEMLQRASGAKGGGPGIGELWRKLLEAEAAARTASVASAARNSTPSAEPTTTTAGAHCPLSIHSKAM